MNQRSLLRRMINSLQVALVLLFCLIESVSAQNFMGISVGYETFPSAQPAKTIPGAEGLEIQTSSWNFGVAYPWQFADGRILMISRLAYRRIQYSQTNTPAGFRPLGHAQSVQVSVFVIDSLTERWSLVASIAPGLASDFEGRVTMDDFALQAMFGFIRKYGNDFQLGFGLAYSRDFGPPLPLPFIYLDWKITPRLTFNGIVPVNLSLRYNLDSMLDLGLAMKVRGDRYHGNPGRYEVSNPQLEYSEATLSPSAHIRFAPWVSLNLEGGFAFYRNFEFLNGNNSAASYDLKPTGYMRAELVLGI